MHGQNGDRIQDQRVGEDTEVERTHRLVENARQNSRIRWRDFERSQTRSDAGELEQEHRGLQRGTDRRQCGGIYFQFQRSLVSCASTRPISFYFFQLAARMKKEEEEKRKRALKMLEMPPPRINFSHIRSIYGRRVKPGLTDGWKKNYENSIGSSLNNFSFDRGKLAIFITVESIFKSNDRFVVGGHGDP